MSINGSKTVLRYTQVVQYVLPMYEEAVVSVRKYSGNTPRLSPDLYANVWANPSPNALLFVDMDIPSRHVSCGGREVQS